MVDPVAIATGKVSVTATVYEFAKTIISIGGPYSNCYRSMELANNAVSYFSRARLVIEMLLLLLHSYNFALQFSATPVATHLSNVGNYGGYFYGILTRIRAMPLKLFVNEEMECPKRCVHGDQMTYILR